MSLIFYIHSSSDNTMVYSDHIPRIGEKLRLKPDDIFPPDGLVGTFEVEDVVYGIPSNRIDVYIFRVGELPDDLSYAAYKASLTTPRNTPPRYQTLEPRG